MPHKLKVLFKILLLFICLSAFVFCKAQTDSLFSFVKSIKGNFTGFAADNLDNIYLLTSTNRLKKLNNKGDSVAVFNDVKRYGTVTKIDVTNPLKILLYYKNFSTIIVLDRFLNIRNTINLRKQNIFSANAISLAYDNNIWLYDEQEYKLKKINDAGKVVLESTDLRMTVDSVPSATQLIDKNNFVYLYDSSKGFYNFDYYCSFKNHLTFLKWNSTGASDKAVYGFYKNKLLTYQLQSLNIQEYNLPAFAKNYIDIKTVNNKLYILKQDGLHIYQAK